MRYMVSAVLIVATACAAWGVASDALLGPARDVGLIASFAADQTSAWQARMGANVSASTRFGFALPGIATDMLQATPRRTDPLDRDPPRNWFALTRTAAMPADLPAEFDGFRVALGSSGQAQWWISMSVKASDGRAFSRLLTDSIFPSGRLVEFLLPLDTFTCGDERLTPALVRSAQSMELAFSVPGADLYIQRISVYRRSRQTAWLDFATNHPASNLFERGDSVEMRFTVEGSLPSSVAQFEWEVRDLAGKTVLRGARPLQGGRDHSVRITRPRYGYYEVRAWWLDAHGRRIEQDSCVRAEGTMPEGLGTFAVLPSTVAENRAMFRRLGRRAFFGLHGDFHGLADRVGLAWRFGYDKWPWLEPARPDRAAGTAEWARKRIAEGAVSPYALHILQFRGNMAEEVPEWARGPEGKAPPFANWDDYLAMVRDSAKVEKARYPGMQPRLYGCAWEANLNMPPYHATPPPFTPGELVELFRRTREAIRSEDPSGQMIGPCPSVMDAAWFETMFKAGVLKYVDAIETHGYSDGAWDPEENDYPGKIAKLNALTRRYAGRKLDIYCTELGQPGILGATVVHRSQAERMVRTAVILKGEGVRVFLPFYGIDYDRLGYWGFLFNRDVDSPEGPWAARRVSPKPLVTAMAACAKILEGTRPVRRVRSFGADVWAYAFARDGQRISVLWKTGAPREIRYPVPARSRVRVLDIEGHEISAQKTGGAMGLRVGESPVYVIEQR